MDTSYIDPNKAMLDFEREEFSIQLREYLTKTIDDRMKDHVHDINRYRDTLRLVLNGLLSGVGSMLVEMQIHAGAKLTPQWMDGMFDNVIDGVIETVRAYEQSGKCPGCGSTSGKDLCDSGH